METAERYRRFASTEVRGHSATYDMLAARIAVDEELLALIDRLPVSKWQPNLLLGAVRFLGGPVADYPAFRAWTLAAWDWVEQTMRGRFTQTNEAGRCATLLPLLASLPQPLALIEVGASAGLCLPADPGAGILRGDRTIPALPLDLQRGSPVLPSVEDRLPRPAPQDHDVFVMALCDLSGWCQWW